VTATAGEDRDFIAASFEDPEAFAAIFDRHFGAVHRFLDRRVGTDAAGRLAGEVFRIAFERRDRFDPTRASALPWLYGIAHKQVLGEYRSRGRHLRAIGRLSAERTIDDVTAEIEARVDAAAAWPGILGALRQLSDGERDVLLLVAWEEMAYDEVADTLGIPIGTVRSRMHRARARLRELIHSNGQERDDQHMRAAERGCR
jgi:RNA polymerase sigma factor (sigma-70 family)